MDFLIYQCFARNNFLKNDSLLKQQVGLVIKDIESSFAKVAKLPKISPNSPEGKKILQQIEAVKKYRSRECMELGMPTEEYRNNLIEVEAYSFGDGLGEMFKKYLSAAA